MASVPQPRDKLENERGENDKVSRRMRKAVQASARKVRLKKTEEGESKGRSGKEMREERKVKETEKEKDDRSEESGRRVGNLG